MSEHTLLVEDDDRLAELVVEYLTQAGFTVGRQADGAEAAARILEEQPDLVILDVMLPGESGLSVLREVRDRYTGPVLMLTARDDPTDEVIGLELGSDDYVAKPVRPRVLLARVQALLRRSRTSNASETIEDGDLVVDRSRRDVRLGGELVELTTAEFGLLWCLICRSVQPVTRDDLFQELRGIDDAGLDRSMFVLSTLPLMPVEADRRLFKRALSNLVCNAARHSDRHLEARSEAATNWLHIHVDDDGPGVPEPDRERIFAPMVRLDSARSRGTGGLGLALARRIALSHGGRLVCQGSPLGGARFTLSWPAMPIKQAPPAA